MITFDYEQLKKYTMKKIAENSSPLTQEGLELALKNAAVEDYPAGTGDWLSDEQEAELERLVQKAIADSKQASPLKMQESNKTTEMDPQKYDKDKFLSIYFGKLKTIIEEHNLNVEHSVFRSELSRKIR